MIPRPGRRHVGRSPLRVPLLRTLAHAAGRTAGVIAGYFRRCCIADTGLGLPWAR